MSVDSREQILANFQACTGLEDLDECITILGQYDWDLLNAVQAVHDRIGGVEGTTNQSTIPKPTPPPPPPPTTATRHTSIIKNSNNHSRSTKPKRHSDSDDNDDSDEPRIIKSVSGSSKASKGATGGAHRVPVRELRFKVEYKDHTENLTIYDSETIHHLQLKIAEKLHIQPNRQKFSNWTSKRYDEHTVLRDLNLPKDNEIHLVATVSSTANGISRSSTTTTSTATSRTTRTTVSPSKAPTHTDFPITVLYEEKTGKSTPFHLVLKPNTKIAEIKKQIEQSAGISVHQQNWSGLMGAKDSDELRHTSINRRAHLIVRKAEDASVTKRDTRQSGFNRHRSEDEPMDVDTEIDLEQYDDDIHTLSQHSSHTTTASSITSNRELLIPDRCTNEVAGLEHFSRVFHARFGSTGPILYIGSLEEAIQGSVLAPRNERRPLVIYIHNDRSVCANVFCTQVLAGETIVEYLANNYVVWAWDITADSNRTRLIETFKRHIGHQYAQRISVMDKDAYPLLLVLIRSRGSLELISVIEGKSTPSEVLLNLIQSHEIFDQQRQRDAEDEIMREKREDLKKQQEDEYHRSLQADLAKEQARLDDERRQKEEKNANERLQQQRLQQQQECIARLPAEPSDTEKNTTRLKIRLPDDEGILMRRFRINDTLQILFDYLTSQGKMFGEYKLLTTYPKRDLTQLNRSDTFEYLKLFPQEQLILENL